MENLTDFTEIGRIVLENIKKTRQEKGLTEETAALKSGIDREQLEKLESGNLTFLPPPYVIALLRKYALALGIYDETLFKQLKESADIPAPKSPRKRTAQSQKSADRTEKKKQEPLCIHNGNHRHCGCSSLDDFRPAHSAASPDGGIPARCIGTASRIYFTYCTTAALHSGCCRTERDHLPRSC